MKYGIRRLFHKFENVTFNRAEQVSTLTIPRCLIEVISVSILFILLYLGEMNYCRLDRKDYNNNLDGVLQTLYR